MIDAPLGLAFAAGLVATVNPCGFAMLPAYLSYFIGLDRVEDPDDGAETGLVAALRVGAIVSAGFLAVFGAAGLLINAGVRAIIDWIPYLALAVGLLMVVLALAMLRGVELRIGAFRGGRGASSRDTSSVFAFGVSYAVASLSCTLPVFLAVVVGSLASTSFVAGLATYVAYGVGMSVVLVALTIAVALAKHGVVRRLRSLLPHVHRISALLLLVAGGYITWFWYDDLASDAGEQRLASDVVDRWSASLTNWIGDHSGAVGLALGGVVGIAVLAAVLKRFEPEPGEHRSGRGVTNPGGPS